ncbi:MAG: SAM-dependent methyltransferase, partial [Nocardioidaceae bacterium]
APPGSGATHRFTADEIASMLEEAGFDTTAMHAVRVFVDLVPSSLVDLEPGAETALVELEKAVAERPEYLPLGTQVHALAIRRT